MDVLIGEREFVVLPRETCELQDRAGLYALLKPLGADYELIELSFHSSLKKAYSPQELNDSDDTAAAVLYVDSGDEGSRILRELEAIYGSPED